MDKTPITIYGSEKLKEELKILKSVERPEVIAAIAEARAQGDLSENAEYDAAKEKQGFIEGRIADIEAKLSNCIIIDPTELQKDGRCVFGTTVVIQDLDSEDEAEYQIVGDDEADIKEKKISISSPLAKALIGKENEDIVEFESPGGLKTYEILKVNTYKTMNPFLNKLSFIFTSIWVGGLWAMLMVTYVIFNIIPSSYIAGVMVSNLFTYINIFGMVTLVLAMIYGFHIESIRFFKKIQAWLALFILVIVCISFFGINPILEALKSRSLSKRSHGKCFCG